MIRTPRLSTIEGQQTLIVERQPPIPPTLDALLSQLYSVTVRNDLRPSGTATACEQWRTHRFDVLREGRHLGLDRVLRDLRIQMCLDCGAVCVRDISVDRLPGLRPGRGGFGRRDRVLGWYSGKRRAGRQHL